MIAKWLMRQPRIILLNDPTRGIDVGTKQELYQLLRQLADAGAAILFYSTDYDELIGCCDRVLVLYDGAIKRELVGAEITERALIASALNIRRWRGGQNGGGELHERLALLARRAARHAARARHLRRDVRHLHLEPSGRLHRQCRADGLQQGRAARLRRDGADAGGDHRRHRPLGRHDLHPDQLPRLLARRRHAAGDGARRRRRAARRRCSAARINGAIVIYGRLQPIVATIATGAVYFGIALLLRPFPGGSVNEDLADALTGRLFGVIPASLVALVAVVLVIWVPFRRSVIGRAAYAAGSSEVAAYMSGVPIRRGKFVAYTLAGLLAAIGGLFLTFFTYTGEAAYASGNAYTLFSIAAVVLGGVSLFGGTGSAIGAIFGAFAFRTIGDLLFVFDFDPLWQPLFQGVVLLLAVSLGAFALFRVRNRLEWFG